MADFWDQETILGKFVKTAGRRFISSVSARTEGSMLISEPSGLTPRVMNSGQARRGLPFLLSLSVNSGIYLMMWNKVTAPTEEIRRAQYIRTAQAAGRQREGADVIEYAWSFTNVKAIKVPDRGT